METQERDPNTRRRYVWTSERLALGLALAALAVTGLLVGLANAGRPAADGDGLAAWWTNFLDPALAGVTVLLAAFLWGAGLTGRWKASLPKRLTVHFVLGADPSQGRSDDEYVFTCHEAYLSGESDIRALGQSIGYQMNNKGNLDFYPYIAQRGPFLVRDGMTRQVYEVTFFLRADPSPDRQTYKIWYDNDEKTPGNKEVELTPRRSTPLSPDEAERERVALGTRAPEAARTPRAERVPAPVLLVNRTPHRVNLLVSGDVELPVDPRHDPPRVHEVRSAARQVMTTAGPLPLIEISYADTIENLPDPKKGVWYLVSRVTAAAAVERDDLVFPLDVDRDDGGDEVRARALGRFARAGYPTQSPTITQS